VETRDPLVRERQLGGGAFPFERFASPLDRLQRRRRPIQLPVTAAEIHPCVRGLDPESELVEALDRVGQELLRRRGLAVEPAQPSHAVEQERFVALVRDVREHALEQPTGLLEGGGALGFRGRPKAGVEGLLCSSRRQEMTGDDHCAVARGE
jgi:hypothetical protein